MIPRPNYYALNYSGSYVAKLYCYYGKPLIGSRQRSQNEDLVVTFSLRYPEVLEILHSNSSGQIHSSIHQQKSIQQVYDVTLINQNKTSPSHSSAAYSFIPYTHLTSKSKEFNHRLYLFALDIESLYKLYNQIQFHLIIRFKSRLGPPRCSTSN